MFVCMFLVHGIVGLIWMEKIFVTEPIQIRSNISLLESLLI